MIIQELRETIQQLREQLHKTEDQLVAMDEVQNAIANDLKLLREQLGVERPSPTPLNRVPNIGEGFCR
jgi:hypothetical protein